MYVYSDENDACVTAVEAGITKVITATYPMMLAVLSSSCNEETRTYSEGQPISRSCDSKTHRSCWPGGSCPGGNCPTRIRRGTFPGGLLSGGGLSGGAC